MHGKLVLSDSTTFEGESFGADLSSSGEVVFNTGMLGYPESLTDPSYFGQILTLTYPLVGSYGVPPQKFLESPRIKVTGLIVQNYINSPSHFESKETLSEWLKKEGIPAISGISDGAGRTARRPADGIRRRRPHRRGGGGLSGDARRRRRQERDPAPLRGARKPGRRGRSEAGGRSAAEGGEQGRGRCRGVAGGVKTRAGSLVWRCLLATGNVDHPTAIISQHALHRRQPRSQQRIGLDKWPDSMKPCRCVLRRIEPRHGDVAGSGRAQAYREQAIVHSPYSTETGHLGQFGNRRLLPRLVDQEGSKVGRLSRAQGEAHRAETHTLV